MFQSRERPPITFQRSLRNKRSMGNKIEISVTQGLDVSNFFKDVPNFINDVPKRPKSISKWGMTSNHFLSLSKWINGP